ncbi:hypothetical protein GMA17_01185 [Bizionia sp. M204]|nr:hypothetical protein GMA17_01185 [Bizionia sp. M204]
MSLIKTHIMKQPIKCIFLLVGILFFTVTACQDEVIEETPPNDQEIIQSDSNLANLMRNTSANNGSVDDILDGSDCFTVNLPVTIVANGITLTIETLTDLSLLEAIFDASNTDEDDLDFLFPITIILNDYTEVNIDSVDTLEAFIDSCIADEDLIECADFVYPISFSIYNTSFQIIDTVVIDNDYELYIFLEGLEDGNNGAVLTSLNFPVSIQYTNSTTIEVANNQALEEAINAANENCYYDCDLDEVIENLQECHWSMAAHSGNNDYVGFDFYFNDNNLLQIIYGTGSLTVSGNWNVSTIDEQVVLTISELTDFTPLEGDWLVETCNDDRLVFTQQINSETLEMVLEQDCFGSPFNCFEDVSITACDFDNDGIAVFELETQVLGNVICTVNFTPSFHVTLADAENNVNAIAQPNSYSNTTNPQTIYLRIEALNGEFQVYEIELVPENCSANCLESDIDNYLQSCVWNVVSYNGDDHLIMYEFDFVSNSEVIVTGNGMTISAFWSTEQSGTSVALLLSGVNGPDIQAVNEYWLIVACDEGRLEMVTANNTNMVMERDCPTCNNPGTLTNDLIIYMPFGNEVRDLIGGTVINDFSLTEDRAGNATCAALFEGNANFSIPVTAQNQLVQGDNFSVSVWFKMQNTTAGNFETIFQKGSVNSEGFQLAVYDLNTPLVSDTTNGYGLWDNDWNGEVDVQWENTDWHHLVVTRDSNNTIRLYRDGQLRNIDENSTFNIDTDPLNDYFIGQFFTGHLDDLRVYKRTLSPNDVGDLYNLEADCFQCL